MPMDSVYKVVKSSRLKGVYFLDNIDSNPGYGYREIMITNVKTIGDVRRATSPSGYKYNVPLSDLEGYWMFAFHQQPESPIDPFNIKLQVLVVVNDSYDYIIDDVRALASRTGICSCNDKRVVDGRASLLATAVNLQNDKQRVLKAVKLLSDITGILYGAKSGDIAKPTKIDHKTAKRSRRRSVAEAILEMGFLS